MKVLIPIIHILFATIISASCEINSNNGTEFTTSKFPDLFKMENYYQCPKNNAFCAANLKLLPTKNDCKFWNTLDDFSKASRYHYNRTVVYRTMCIPENFHSENDKKFFIEDKINQEVRSYNLTTELFSLNCMEPKEYKFDMNIFKIVTILYLILLIIATIYNETVYNKKNHSKLEKILVCFSVTNFKNSSIFKSKDFQRLKCIQGLRTLLAIFVISGHTILVFSLKNIRNPEYVESMLSSTIFKYVLILSYTILSLFFCISTWFLTLQILTMHHRKNQFTLKDMGLIILHRISRIWPILVVKLFIGIPILTHVIYGPSTFEISKMMYNSCEKYWWVTFLFASNLLSNSDACHLGMWYLSVDSQLYLMAMFFWYFVLKFKWNIKKSIFMLFIASYIIVALIIYIKELGPDALINAKLLTNINFFKDQKTPYTLFGFWINSSSSILGILFGYFYFCSTQIENKPEPYEKYYSKIFIIVPLLPFILADINNNPFVTAIFGALIRPLFTFGLITGLYGISRNVIKGPVKLALEHKYLVNLGKFTFCTYVFHFLWVFKRGAHYSQTVELDSFKVLLWLIIDTVVSFIIGIILTFTIEFPFIFIGKLILPPVWKKSSDDMVQDKTD